jgi:hypothetical protein
MCRCWANRQGAHCAACFPPSQGPHRGQLTTAMEPPRGPRQSHAPLWPLRHHPRPRVRPSSAILLWPAAAAMEDHSRWAFRPHCLKIESPPICGAPCVISPSELTTGSLETANHHRHRCRLGACLPCFWGKWATSPGKTGPLAVAGQSHPPEWPVGKVLLFNFLWFNLNFQIGFKFLKFVGISIEPINWSNQL